MKKTVTDIANYLKGSVQGDGNLIIEGITNLTAPHENHITFVEHKRLLQELEKSAISCIVAPEGTASEKKTLITVKNPKLAFARLMQLFYPPKKYSGTISKQACIAPSVRLGKNVTVEAFAVIGDQVCIGDNSTIRSFAHIDVHTVIGTDTVIHPNVMVYDHTQIGNNVIIHSSTVIGSDGFGYVRDETGTHVKVPQIGNVLIEDNVEIGSNVSIDRATFGSTVIKKGAKIDNLVQIAHNVTIGEETALSGHAGIAGSATIGNYCTIAAQVGIADHVTIEDKVILGGQTGVPSKKRIPANGIFMGTPARPFAQYKKQQGLLAKLPHILEQLQAQKKASENTKDKS